MGRIVNAVLWNHVVLLIFMQIVLNDISNIMWQSCILLYVSKTLYFMCCVNCITHILNQWCVVTITGIDWGFKFFSIELPPTHAQVHVHFSVLKFSQLTCPQHTHTHACAYILFCWNFLNWTAPNTDKCTCILVCRIYCLILTWFPYLLNFIVLFLD